MIKPQYRLPSVFSEGLALVAPADGNSYFSFGFIDKSGKIIIQPQPYSASSFSEGLAAIMIERTIGFIDKNGETVIQPVCSAPGVSYEFDNLGSMISEETQIYGFKDGLARCGYGYGFTYIDKQGKVVYDPRQDLDVHPRQDLDID